MLMVFLFHLVLALCYETGMMMASLETDLRNKSWDDLSKLEQTKRTCPIRGDEMNLSETVMEKLPFGGDP